LTTTRFESLTSGALITATGSALPPVRTSSPPSARGTSENSFPGSGTSRKTNSFGASDRARINVSLIPLGSSTYSKSVCGKTVRYKTATSLLFTAPARAASSSASVKPALPVSNRTTPSRTPSLRSALNPAS
jgi:hypothetical protein